MFSICAGSNTLLSLFCRIYIITYGFTACRRSHVSVHEDTNQSLSDFALINLSVVQRMVKRK